MVTRNICYKALISDFDKKIVAKKAELDRAPDARTRSRLQDEIAQMQQLSLNLKINPSRVFNTYLR